MRIAGTLRNSCRSLLPLISSHQHPKVLQHFARGISVFSTSEPNGNGNNDAWVKAVSDAEKIVGFPTSFLSLRALLSDEFSGLAIHLRKLVSTKHPLLNTARGIVFDSKNYMQTRGLVVLLISKAIGCAEKARYGAAEMHKKQRSLAEITELIHIAFLVHRGIVDVNELCKQQKVSKADLEFGNKMAVLGGDFLLANACTSLAGLQDTKIVDLMSSSIEDMSGAMIMIPETGPISKEIGLEYIPSSRKDWESIVGLAHGSLLCNACVSATHLYEDNPEIRKGIVDFATNFVLAQQARHDMLRFDSLEALNRKPDFCSLCTLPVALLADGNSDWIKTFVQPIDGTEMQVDVKRLFNTVSSDPHALERAQTLCVEYISKSTSSLSVLLKSDARDALCDIIKSIIK